MPRSQGWKVDIPACSPRRTQSGRTESCNNPTGVQAPCDDDMAPLTICWPWLGHVTRPHRGLACVARQCRLGDAGTDLADTSTPREAVHHDDAAMTTNLVELAQRQNSNSNSASAPKQSTPSSPSVASLATNTFTTTPNDPQSQFSVRPFEPH